MRVLCMLFTYVKCKIMMNDSTGLFVIKRDKRHEAFISEKLFKRLEKLCWRPYKIDVSLQPLINEIIKTLTNITPDRRVDCCNLDFIIANIAVKRLTDHPLYYILASRLTVSRMHKKTIESFSAVVTNLYEKRMEGGEEPRISKSFFETAVKNADRLENAIDFERDYLFDYIALKILEKNYLFKINGNIVERPQHLLMRVSLAIHGNDIDAALETYEYMSKGYFLHSCQTLQSAGTVKLQISSDVAVTLEDAKDGVFKCLTQSDEISKSSLNVSISVHNVPAKGTHIAGIATKSLGLGPLLVAFNDSLNTLRGKDVNTGDFAFYLEPWHADIFRFLELKESWEDDGAPDLHYAIWIPDLFMDRVAKNKDWSIMCPKTSPGLSEVWGDDFKRLYEKYEHDGKQTRKINAIRLWEKILQSQIKTNSPVILFKDRCNEKSNHQHLGTIKGSTLGTETVQFYSDNEFAISNTASIAINKFLTPQGKAVDLEKLKLVAGILTRNLNKLIDATLHLASGMKAAQLRHRPLAIGVEGLAETFAQLRLPYNGMYTSWLNKSIFETIYFGAMSASVELARQDGHYLSYKGSPLSKGLWQFNFWKGDLVIVNDWQTLKKSIAKTGARNSLLIAIKRPDHLSHIMGTSETIEPFFSNLYKVDLFSETFLMINIHLAKVLLEENLWNKSVLNELRKSNGSLQGCDSIPSDLKAAYKTAWEIESEVILKRAVERGRFIDQNQAVKLYMNNSSVETLNKIYFQFWKRGLKSCPYKVEIKSERSPKKVFSSKRDEIRENFSWFTNTNLSKLVSSEVD